MFAGLRSAQYNWKGGNTFLRQHLLPSSHMKSTELCLPCRHPDISAAPSRDYCYYYSVLSLFQAKLAYKRCLTAEFNAGEEPHSWPVSSPIAEQIQLPAHAPKGLWANVSKEEQRSLMHWPRSRPHPFRWTWIWQPESWSSRAWNAGWASAPSARREEGNFLWIEISDGAKYQYCQTAQLRLSLHCW